MPILHRLACFRDDVVFLIFLYQVRKSHARDQRELNPLEQIFYQRWIYRIDPKRVNEYGQVMNDEEVSKETKKNQ